LLPDVALIFAFHAVIVPGNHRSVNTIAALNADLMRKIRRIYVRLGKRPAGRAHDCPVTRHLADSNPPVTLRAPRVTFHKSNPIGEYLPVPTGHP